MTTGFFEGLSPSRFQGTESTDPLAFRHYDPDEMVHGTRMEDHLRFAIAYWHSFAWEGGDPFGGFGTVGGLMLALAVLQVISSGFNQIGLSPYLTAAIWGLVLIGVMAVQTLRLHLRGAGR